MTHKTTTQHMRGFALLLSGMLFSMLGFAQVTVSGKVTEANAATSPTGISVVIRGTSFGGTTDAAGNYSISAPLKSGNYTLIFSGVGYQRQEQNFVVGSASSYTVDVQLTAQISKLDEVIVTGTSLGTTRKQLGSYISTLGGSELTKGATGNVLASLQGKPQVLR